MLSWKRSDSTRRSAKFNNKYHAPNFRGFFLPAARVAEPMTTAIEYGNPDLWLVLLMLAAGVISNALLSTDPINLRRLSGDILRGVLVAIVIWSYGLLGEISILQVIIWSGLSAVAWPHAINGITAFVKQKISRLLGRR